MYLFIVNGFGWIDRERAPLNGSEDTLAFFIRHTYIHNTHSTQNDTYTYSYGYTSPPPGNDSISLLSQNLLLSQQAQSQNSGCINTNLAQTPPCAVSPAPSALKPVCTQLNNPTDPNGIYGGKFDIISTFNPYTWPTSTSNSNLPTNSFCTQVRRGGMLL